MNKFDIGKQDIKSKKKKQQNITDLGELYKSHPLPMQKDEIQHTRSCQKERQPKISAIDPVINNSYSLIYPDTDIRLICKNKEFPYPGFTAKDYPCCFRTNQHGKKDYIRNLNQQENINLMKIDIEHIATTQHIIKTKLLGEGQLGVLNLNYLNELFNSNDNLEKMKEMKNYNKLNHNKFLRYGIQQNNDSFIYSVFVCLYYKEKSYKKNISIFKADFVNKLTLDVLRGLDNGDLLIKLLRNPNLINIKNFPDITDENKLELENIILQKYKEFILNFNGNYTLLYDYMEFFNTTNIFIFDVSNKGNIICSKNNTLKYATNIFLIKRDNYFEPIFLFTSQIKRSFKSGIMIKNIKKLYNYTCNRQKEQRDINENVKAYTLYNILQNKSFFIDRFKPTILHQYINIYNKVTHIIIKGKNNNHFILSVKPGGIVDIVDENLKNESKKQYSNISIIQNLDNYKKHPNETFEILQGINNLRNDILKKQNFKEEDLDRYKIQGIIKNDDNKIIALLPNNGYPIPTLIVDESELDENLKNLKLFTNYFDELDPALFYSYNEEDKVQDKVSKRNYKDIIINRVFYELSHYFKINQEKTNKIKIILENVKYTRQIKKKALKDFFEKEKILSDILIIDKNYKIPDIIPIEFKSCIKEGGDIFCKTNSKGLMKLVIPKQLSKINMFELIFNSLINNLLKDQTQAILNVNVNKFTTAITDILKRPGEYIIIKETLQDFITWINKPS